MDAVAYEAFCLADPIYYENPDRVDDSDTAIAPSKIAEFQDWDRAKQGVWSLLSPRRHSLQHQGWKIHISCLPHEAEEVLDIASGVCFEEGVPFKHLRSVQMMNLMNSKYSARSSSGKFITIYPPDDQALERLVNKLSHLLAGRPGPYILSDLRCGESPVFVRYGGFIEQYCVGPDGTQTLAVRDPSGQLVPDERGPGFSIPTWVEVPAFIRQNMDSLARQSKVELPYDIESALHFSNGGGVYKAVARSDGRKVILKEARPHSGLAPDGSDAVSRLRREHTALERLSGLDCVPRLVGYEVHWEHHFLVQEFVEGKPLQRAFVERFPLIRHQVDDAKVRDYTAWALDVLQAVERAVGEVHGAGLAFGDLHPNNIMIRPDGTVCLVDLELCFDPSSESSPAMGAPGFRNTACTGFDIDRYGLAVLRIFLFQPMVALLGLDPGKASQFAETITELFPVPAGYAHRAVGELAALAAGGGPLRASHGIEPSWPIGSSWSQSAHTAAKRLIAEGIRASATPERADRLFPGDIAVFREGGYTLAHGAAGVLYALGRSGTGLVEEHLVNWLVTATERAARPRPGFFDGLHGVARALDSLGRKDQALEVLDRAMHTTCDLKDPTLYSGLAGIGINLLHFAGRTGDDSLTHAALSVGERLTAQLGSAPTHEGRAGLLSGPSGTALFFIRLFEATGDSAQLARARAAIIADLARCRTDDEGALQVHDGWRLLPYLGNGSTGIGVAIQAYLRHREDSELDQARLAIRRACDVTFTIQAGLFQGRAGVMAYAGLVDGAESETVRRHLSQLSWHAVRLGQGLGFPGNQLLRLSMDMATGSAGILLAMEAAENRSEIFGDLLGGTQIPG